MLKHTRSNSKIFAKLLSSQPFVNIFMIYFNLKAHFSRIGASRTANMTPYMTKSIRLSSPWYPDLDFGTLLDIYLTANQALPGQISQCGGKFHDLQKIILICVNTRRIL